MKAEELAKLADISNDNAPRLDPWKLRCMRVGKRLTTSALAQACGYTAIGHTELSHIECYDTIAGAARAAKMAAGLGCDVRDIQSDANDFYKGRQKYDAWVADGRPSLGKWLRSR